MSRAREVGDLGSVATVDSNGNVGINTSSPDNNSGYTALTISNTSGNGGGQVYVKAVSATGVFGADNASSGANAKVILQTNTSHPLAFGTNGAERMRIDSSGNVGIGTTSPDAASGYTTLALNGSTSGWVQLKSGGTNVADWYSSGGTESTFRSLSGGFNFTISGSDAFKFVSNSTERMRIDSSGNVFVNSTNFPVVGIEKFGVNGSTTIAGAFGNNSSTNASLFVSNNYNGTSKLVQFAAYLGQSVGSITTNGSTSTSYNTSSDYRLKENITPLDNAATRLAQIPVHRFNFIADPNTTVDGFLAHEVQAIVPEAVTGEKDAMREEEYIVTPAVEATYDEEGNVLTQAVPAVMGTRTVPDYQGIDQSKLVPLLTAALQEALQKIDALEARIATLEGGA